MRCWACTSKSWCANSQTPGEKRGSSWGADLPEACSQITCLERVWPGHLSSLQTEPSFLSSLVTPLSLNPSATTTPTRRTAEGFYVASVANLNTPPPPRGCVLFLAFKLSFSWFWRVTLSRPWPCSIQGLQLVNLCARGPTQSHSSP